MGAKYPIVQFAYTRGISNVLDSDFDYQKAKFNIEESFLLKGVGKTKIEIEGGWIDRPLPYALLFTGEGSYARTNFIIIPHVFQTIRPYEFLSDKYVNLFFEHNFGHLLFKHHKIAPELSIVHNMGWGALSQKDWHSTISFNTKEKGFNESGIKLDNLFKLEYLDIAYIGLGVGIYYRYRSNEEILNNSVLKLSLTYSTK